MDWTLAMKLSLSLGLGLLVGFQREWSASHVAGIRTFALVTLYGTLMGLLRGIVGPWGIGAGMLALTAMFIVVDVRRSAGHTNAPGLTTLVAALIMYVVGVAIAADQIEMAVLMGAGVATILQWKQPLHVFVDRIGQKDMHAIFQLVLIGLIVLPVLPDKDFGPYSVLNPHEIWLMVVLICGISVSSYMVYKFFGAQAGTAVGGLLGGLISSTATTVSYSRHSKRSPEAASVACLAITIASTIVFGRVLTEVALVAPSILPRILPPLGVMMGVMGLLSAILLLRSREMDADLPEVEDPAGLKAALLFGALYAAVLFAVAFVREHSDNTSLYGVAALSGLTDMDAITLSTAQMIKAGRLDVDTGWRMILTGGMSNLVFKTLAVALLGSRTLLRSVAIVFGIAFATGSLLLLFWP